MITNIICGHRLQVPRDDRNILPPLVIHIVRHALDVMSLLTPQAEAPSIYITVMGMGMCGIATWPPSCGARLQSLHVGSVRRLLGDLAPAVTLKCQFPHRDCQSQYICICNCTCLVFSISELSTKRRGGVSHNGGEIIKRTHTEPTHSGL
jgi:hypothetical protein